MAQNFRLLDSNYVDVLAIDSFMSILWVDRYAEYGEFILEMPASETLVKELQNGRYIWASGKSELMMIETQNVTSSGQNGDVLRVSGRSMAALLSKRIIWKTTTIKSGFETGIKKLLNENIINPTDAKRKIPNISWLPSGDPRIESIKLDFQSTGDNLYSLISTLCALYGVGFRMVYDQKGAFAFQLYMGDNRTFSQFENPYITFSPEFENLSDSEYLNSISSYKNVALVAGEDPKDGEARRTKTVGDASGIDRTELYVDARDIQSETPDGFYPPEEYDKFLVSRGEQKLEPYKKDVSVVGSVEDGRTFTYDIDYFLGDVVQLVTTHNVDIEVRVTEIVYTKNVGEESLIPTFIIEERSDDK